MKNSSHSNMHAHSHDYLLRDNKIASNEKRTFIVVLLTLVTMVVEIAFGYMTGSMALLADGWHMTSHVGALGISLIAYRLARSKKLSAQFSFGTGKFIPLGGYTSAIMLGLVALFMMVESLFRLLNPIEISFGPALWVAFVGLIVNLLSAAILWNSGHDHEHDHDHEHEHEHKHVHDHNHESALLHVVADAFTSLLAIGALFLGKYFNLMWADPVIGILGGVVILKWAYGLCKSTLWELLDGESKLIPARKIKKIFASYTDIEISDLHIWRVAPNAHAAEMIVYSKELRGADFYRSKIAETIVIDHFIIEERLL